MSFKPTKHFKQEYRRLWKENPEAANLFLLLCELADKNGQVYLPADEQNCEQALAELMAARFNDPGEYAL